MNTEREPARVRAWRMRVREGEGSLLFSCASEACEEIVARSAQVHTSESGWARLDPEAWGCAHCHGCGELVLEPEGWCPTHEAEPCSLHEWALSWQAQETASELVDATGWEVLAAWASERGENWESGARAVEELRVAELEFRLGQESGGDEPS